MEEEKAGRDFKEETSTTEESSKEMNGQEMAQTMVDAVNGCERIHTNPLDNKSSSSDNPSPKPSLSYIALIAKVLMSSPSQKLNLSSIYKAMEEQFPYLRSRGPGWRNSVRHSLSVNECFVKVRRCEDGRGHYWGVHQAHLTDFQQGNFRQTRAKGRRKRCDKVAGCRAWMQTSYFLGSFFESRSLGCVEPQCPLQELRRYQTSSLAWTQPYYQPWSITAGWVQSPTWMRHWPFPERLPDKNEGATAGRGYTSYPMTSTLHRQMNDPALEGMKESYGSRVITPSEQELRFASAGLQLSKS